MAESPAYSPPAHGSVQAKKNYSKRPGSTRSRPLKDLASPGATAFAVALLSVVAGLIVLGRLLWNDRYYTSEEGLGYILGLTGGIMMLVACLYALLKRLRPVRAAGVMRHLLRIHIFFGIVGPVLVLFHSTFRIGSLNGGIALVSMLLVFSSGVVGRYLHSRIHTSLAGTRADWKEMREALSAAGKTLRFSRLEAFEQSVLQEKDGLLQALFMLISFRPRVAWLRIRLKRDVKKHLAGQASSPRDAGRRYLKEANRHLSDYFAILRKVALFSVYERLFAFWHHAHVPLLYLLLLSGIVHVVAVHMY